MTTKLKSIDEIIKVSIYYKDINETIGLESPVCYLTGGGGGGGSGGDPEGMSCGYPTSSCWSIPYPKYPKKR
ncbi:hypothetical protein [Acidianus brierleyi]|uniref:Uncharacterized protein n=1 Tax=Acidianus brierleyi TaxID=41673 RepID=A0A2U9IHP7_9CREN|nr:hypothetical protein [Acidianus brierleyi]AWR95505.1 hypothetical protein DFR85_13795 [Acidianus brierleyi]